MNQCKGHENCEIKKVQYQLLHLQSRVTATLSGRQDAHKLLNGARKTKYIYR